MYYGILGPLEVTNASGTVEMRGFKQRIILTALLLDANDVVPVDRLVDWLWPRRPPERAHEIIQVHVSRLRRRLEPDHPPWTPSAVLGSRPPGYLLHVDTDGMDVQRVQRLVEAGRYALERGDPTTASGALAAALSLWRGRPLADVVMVTAAQDAIAKLDALRLSATVMRIDADLAIGRHMAVVPELQELVRTHPLDERLCAQLMISLYRCGRQAESLAAYQRVSQRLADELDVRPSPQSRRLRAAILAQDPELDSPREPSLAWSGMSSAGSAAGRYDGAQLPH